MPELPEVEVLVRHLKPALVGRSIRKVQVRRARIVRPHAPDEIENTLRGAQIVDVRRRAKFILFEMETRRSGSLPRTSGSCSGPRATRRKKGHSDPFTFIVVGHLGMTGRMYLLPAKADLPKHAAVVMDLGAEQFVFEDTRYFGRLMLGAGGLENLGPEPLDKSFTGPVLGQTLKASRQPIKVKLLDQRVVAGVGNIYASEALFRAGIAPQRASNKLTRLELDKLAHAIRQVLARAIRFGSTVPLDFGGEGEENGLFYYGTKGHASYEERLAVYDRAGKACLRCGGQIRRISQASRSTYFCPGCQPKRARK